MVFFDNVIGRKKEKELLEKLLISDQAEFLVVYGRRRVGKTFLIREKLFPFLVFDFTGSYEMDMGAQLDQFFQEYLQRTKGQKEPSTPPNWSKAFQYLANHLATLKPKKKKHVVFIDELPWLDTPRSGFLSAFEFFWNQYLSKMPNILLVCCGSATSWIQNKLFRAKGGLYHRVTKRIQLQPFTLAETKAFCDHKNIKLNQYQILHLYMVMGGIPYYLNEIKSGKSAIQLIDEICFTKNGLLRDDYDMVYDSLFKNPENHRKIIETLAGKPNGMVRKEIVQYSQLSDGGSINRALEELELCGFITRFQPFQKKKKDTIYKVTDLYSLFYLKFIKDNRISGSGSWITLANSSSFRAWSEYAYESICTLHIDQIKRALGISGVHTDISAWKSFGNDEVPGAQIDLVINRNDQIIHLCEAKFTDHEYIINKSYAADLRRKRSVFKNITKTKKSLFTTLITTYPTIQNKYYLDEIQSEVTMEDLFQEQ